MTGARIKSIRKECGLSQTDFGARLGVTDGAISLLERGGRQLTDQMAKAIVREFDVNPLYLESGDEPMFKQPDDDVASLAADIVLGESDLSKAFLKTIASLTEDELALLEKMMKRVAKELDD